MLYFIKLSTAFLSAYFLGRIIYLYFCNPKEKPNIISMIHSFLLGLGFSSISFWFYTIATNGYNSNYHYIELSFIAIIYIYLWIKKGKRIISLPSLPRFFSSKNKVAGTKKRQLINYMIVVLFCFIGVLCLVGCLRYPDGTWDAIAMWNFRAKFLSLGNEEWNRMYFDTFDYSHRDYPLFLSCTIARGYNYVGRIDTIVPMFFSWFFTIITFLLPYLYLKRLKNKYYSVVAVCILTYSPQIIFYGCMQYADVPLAVFILISLYEFIIWNMKNENLPWIGMFFAGLCFWIKNEGIPWYLIYCLLIIYSLYKRDNNLKSSIKNFLRIIFASLPIIIAFLFVRYFANSENDLVYGILDRLKQIFDIERYKLMKIYVWWFIKQNLWILFIPMFLYFGFIDKRYIKFKYLFFIIFLMYLVFIFVYLITPHDLLWHLSTSFLRITIIYLPSLMFLSCLLFNYKREK